MKICPRCGSGKVDWIIPQNWSVWECKDCDYTGPIIEGDKKIAEEIKKGYKVKLRKEKIRKKKFSKNDEKRNIEQTAEKKEIEEDISDEEIDRRLESLNI